MPDVAEEELVNEGALPPDDFHEDIERIAEVAHYELEVPDDINERASEAAKGLLIDPAKLYEAATALAAGHLVLEGPPGTGKTSLARALCRAFHCGVLQVTAHENWSTYEVIGRQELRVDSDGHEEIWPVNGYFTEGVVRCAGGLVRHFDDPDEPQATWLLIDELNRAHADKAFGELFTILGSDEQIPITLSYQREGNRELVTPRRFRIVATLNSIDRQFVNSLSQGLRRRFTFIPIDIPPKRQGGEPWYPATASSSLGARELTVVIERAARRVAQRAKLEDAAEAEDAAQKLIKWLAGPGLPSLEALFDLVERVRYVGKGEPTPYLPLGTAQLIDTVELFLTRMKAEDFSDASMATAIDWAASVKLAPLFDADTVTEADLEQFAEGLTAPFSQVTKRQLLAIAAAGLYYIAD
jgi:5-methylcytosine-specific restriction protein B